MGSGASVLEQPDESTLPIAPWLAAQLQGRDVDEVVEDQTKASVITEIFWVSGRDWPNLTPTLVRD